MNITDLDSKMVKNFVVWRKKRTPFLDKKEEPVKNPDGTPKMHKEVGGRAIDVDIKAIKKVIAWAKVEKWIESLPDLAWKSMATEPKTIRLMTPKELDSFATAGLVSAGQLAAATHAGTGILLNPTVILTCAHVFEEMQVDSRLIVQGTPKQVVRTKSHPHIDIGIIELKEQCDFYSGLAFQEPGLLDEIYVFGFPKIPFTSKAAMIVHKGEVTNPYVQTLDAQDIFLFSAIARPGNSGGPIVSKNGYVVGIVSRDLFYKDQNALPFYAGTPTSGIRKALAEIDSTIELQMENYI